MPKNVPASDYTAYIREKASFDSRNPPGLFNSLVVESDVARGLPPPVPSPPVFGDYGILTGFSNTKSLYYPGFGITGDFTLELFFTVDILPVEGDVTICGTDDESEYIDFNIYRNVLRIRTGGGGEYNIHTVSPGVWYHFGLTRSGTNYYYSVDGITALIELDDQDISGQGICVGDWAPGEEPFRRGSISNFRFSDYARYTSTFSIPTLPLSADNGTRLLLLATQNAPFADSSGNNYVAEGSCDWVPGPLSRYEQSVVSGFSPNDYYLVQTTNLGVSGDFTIECFAYVLSEPYGTVFTSDDENIRVALDYDGYNQYVHYNNNDTTPVPATKWVHFAIVRTDGTCELYIDGVNSASWVASFDSQLWIGSSSSSWSFSDGISNLRVSDYARYTQSFTPSLPLTADSGTTLLLTDGFSGPASEDVDTYGSLAIATGSVPYRPASTYPIISGFSSTSYLTVDTNNLFGTNGEFTIECFAYIDSSTNGNIFGDYEESAIIRYNNGSIEYLFEGLTDSNLLDKWTHFAIVWDGTTHRVYFDGFLYDTYTGYPYGGPLYIGSASDSSFSNGRISGFRISNYARYTDDFPPTLPMIEDDGTTLLITDSIANSLIESPNTKPQVTREFINYVRYDST